MSVCLSIYSFFSRLTVNWYYYLSLGKTLKFLEGCVSALPFSFKSSDLPCNYEMSAFFNIGSRLENVRLGETLKRLEVLCFFAVPFSLTSSDLS